MFAQNSIIENIVDRSIHETLLSFNFDISTDEIKSNNVRLFGKEGLFDSIGLVSLILSIEEKLRDELKQDILLANEKALSQKNSPFKDYQSLTMYVATMV